MMHNYVALITFPFTHQDYLQPMRLVTMTPVEL